MRKLLWSADNWQQKYDTDKFSIISTCFLSTKPNTHMLEISDDILRECAKSILGSFLVADVSGFDFGNHSPEEIIIGYAPIEQDIVFKKDNDGYTEAYCEFVLSKVYASKAVDIFAEFNSKSVSVEMLVDEDNGIVNSFDIVGLTVLGETVKPSCSSAFAEVTRFSVNEANNAYSLWASTEAPVNTAEENTGEGGEVNMNNEDIVKEDEIEKPVENAEAEAEVCPDCGKDPCECEPVENACGGKPEDMACGKIENACGNVEAAAEEDMACGRIDNACGKIEAAEDAEPEAEDDDTVSERMAELEAQLEAKDNMISEMQAELEELRAFKEAAEDQANEAAVDEVLKEVADALDEEQLAEFRAEGCASKENFAAWSNKVKAAAFSAGATKKTAAVKQSLWGTTFSYATPNNFNTQSRGLWD